MASARVCWFQSRLSSCFDLLGLVACGIEGEPEPRRLSITLSADFCVEALEEALAQHGKPEIFNSDQGSQFTSTGFIKVLKDAEIAISMDGKGAWRDNVFVERLWRTIKYEEVYLRAYAGVTKPGLRSAGIWASTTARGPVGLAGELPIRHTSTWRRQSRRQPEMGGEAT